MELKALSSVHSLAESQVRPLPIMAITDGLATTVASTEVPLIVVSMGITTIIMAINLTAVTLTAVALTTEALLIADVLLAAEALLVKHLSNPDAGTKTDPHETIPRAPYSGALFYAPPPSQRLHTIYGLFERQLLTHARRDRTKKKRNILSKRRCYGSCRHRSRHNELTDFCFHR